MGRGWKRAETLRHRASPLPDKGLAAEQFLDGGQIRAFFQHVSFDQ
jgi:hypothetical protein